MISQTVSQLDSRVLEWLTKGVQTTNLSLRYFGKPNWSLLSYSNNLPPNPHLYGGMLSTNYEGKLRTLAWKFEPQFKSMCLCDAFELEDFSLILFNEVVNFRAQPFFIFFLISRNYIYQKYPSGEDGTHVHRECTKTKGLLTKYCKPFIKSITKTERGKPK